VNPADRQRLLGAIRAFRGRRILVLADLVADEFVYGRTDRVSREAPVLILRHAGAEVRLGGGANAVHNLRTLGGRPLPVGVVGKDAHGRALRALFRAKRIDPRHVGSEPGYATPVKTRILAGGTHSTKQQVVRIDRLMSLAGRPAAARRLVALLRRLEAVAVLITRGSDGMALFERGRPPLHIPIHGSDQVADVTGAGDTVIAAFTLALAAGAVPADAARLANCAGGIVVMKRGTATVSAAELRAAVRA